MPVENRNGRHIGLSMKRAYFMDGSRENGGLSMKRADFMDGSRKNGSLSTKRADSMDRDRTTRKKNEF